MALLLAFSLPASLWAHPKGRVIEYREVEQGGTIGAPQTAVINDMLLSDDNLFARNNMFRPRHVITVTVTKEPVTEYYTQTVVEAPTAAVEYPASAEQLPAVIPDDNVAWNEEAAGTELVYQTEYTVVTETVPETTSTRTFFEQTTITVVVTVRPISGRTTALASSSVNSLTQTATNIFQYSATSFSIDQDDLLFRANAAAGNSAPACLLLLLLLAFAL